MAQKPEKKPFPASAEGQTEVFDTPADPLTSDSATEAGYDPRYPYPSNTYNIVNLYKGRKAEIPAEKRSEFLFQNDPLYTAYNASTFSSAPDGVYVWIYSTAHGFYAMRVYSKVELGTKHFALVARVRTALGLPILRFKYAGELQKTGSAIVFNLLSGSFMAEYMNRLLDRYTIALPELNAIVLQRASAALQTALPDISVAPSDAPMTTMISNNVSANEAARLKERGFAVTLKNSVGGARRRRRTARGRRRGNRQTSKRRAHTVTQRRRA